jgi:phosphotransferase system enzyme I (PtsI)
MTEKIIQGIAAADGIAIGEAFIYRPPELTIPDRSANSPDEEMARFITASQQAAQEILQLKDRMAERAGAENAAIFEAHALMLEDPALQGAVQARIESGEIAERAAAAASEELAAMLSGMDNELFAARAADVLDVGRRILRILLGIPDTSLEALARPAIVVADDLSPSDTARLKPEFTLGFCTAAGGLTSHTSILARSLGIPAVVGIGAASLAGIQPSDLLALDGSTGAVVVRPSPITIDQYQTVRADKERLLRDAQAQAGGDTYTADHRRAEVCANIGDVETALQAVQNGAEGVGLPRTEFFYLQDTHPPNEERQIEAYRAIFEAMAGRPVIVRTLDIGGD